jgi:protein-S-isoprenylcysteine O-methyltransferase Ste14
MGGRWQDRTMIERIRDHNNLNGIRFATIEFSVIALVGAVLTLIMLVLGRWIPGLIFMGITANCLVIVVIGAYSWQAGKVGTGWSSLRNKLQRDQITRVHPHMLRDTVILVVALLLPFVVIAAAVVETFMAKRRTKR